MIKSWEDLEVLKKAHLLVLEIYKHTKSFPNEEKYRIVDQICRAAISMPTNIAEGKGRNSIKEYIHFLSIAKGSVEEVKYLLLLSKDLAYLDENAFENLSLKCAEIGKMLNGLIKSLKAPKPDTMNLTPGT